MPLVSTGLSLCLYVIRVLLSVKSVLGGVTLVHWSNWLHGLVVDNFLQQDKTKLICMFLDQHNRVHMQSLYTRKKKVYLTVWFVLEENEVTFFAAEHFCQYNIIKCTLTWYFSTCWAFRWGLRLRGLIWVVQNTIMHTV